MKYAIPSYKRAAKQETLEFLVRMGVPNDDIYIFVQTDDDYSLYSERYSKLCHVIHRVADCVPKARNNILDFFGGKADIVMMDDDISCLSYGCKGTKFCNVESGRQFEETMETMFAVSASLGGSMFGLYPVYNEFFMSNDISTRVTVNTILGFPQGFALRFRNDFRAKEDIELCGRILNKGGKVVRFNNVAFKAKHRTNPGGAYDAWHSNINQILSRELQRMYPKVFKIKSNNPNEVRMLLKDEKQEGIVWRN